jgi:hypothetical protein
MQELEHEIVPEPVPRAGRVRLLLHRIARAVEAER